MIRPPQRRTVAALTLSAAALVGIVLHEGYTDRAVIPVKGDVPTIGFGTTSGVKIGDTITPPKALAYFVGSSAFCKSTLVNKLYAEVYAGACAELLRWRFFQGKDCALPANARLCGGLAIRRQAEYRQCLGEGAP